MKITILFVLSLFYAGSIQAESLRIFCLEETDLSCNHRVRHALERMSCEVETDSVQCEAVDQYQEVCRAETRRCFEPAANFLFTTTCGAEQELSLWDYDRGLTLTWWMEFPPYLRKVCRRAEQFSSGGSSESETF